MLNNGPENQHFQSPHLSWNAWHKSETQSTNSSAISSQVLFPLALALIELSLCRPINVLQTDKDENPEEAVSLLNTANRCLGAVCSESGQRYGTVVRRCLYWSETSETDPDDEDFRSCFFELIVDPLLNVIKVFDAR